MAIRVGCPSCRAVQKFPDSSAGKTVRCTECEAAMALPAAEFEVVDAPKRSGRDDRASSRRRRDEDDYDDRPRKRRDEDEDYDRPRRKKPLPMGLLIGGGVAALVVVLVGGLWAAGVFSGGKRGGAAASGRTPPAGWTVAAGEDFSAFQRGNAKKVNFNNGSTTWNTSHGGQGRYEDWASHIDKESYSVKALAYENYKPENSEESLEREWKALGHRSGHAPWDKITSRTMTTFNGHPCLDIRWRYNENWQDDAQAKAGFKRNPGARPERDDRQQFHAARVIVIGEKVFLLTVETDGAPLPDEHIKTFFDSFQAR